MASNQNTGHPWHSLDAFGAFSELIAGAVDASTAVNIFELAGFPHWELVSSNIWAYFLDPAKPHGLGTLFYDSLLSVLARQYGISFPEGAANQANQANQANRTQDISVQREFVTQKGNRVDIAVFASTVSLAIENKVNASIYNDLDDYHQSVAAVAEGDETYTLVLAPRNAADELNTGSAVYAVSYDELFAAVNERLTFDAIQHADPRSLDLYRQFMESQSPSRKEQSRMKEDEVLKEFLSKIDGKDELINNYYRDLAAYIAACKSKLHKVWELVKQERACEGWEWEGVDSRHNAYPNIWYGVKVGEPNADAPHGTSSANESRSAGAPSADEPHEQHSTGAPSADEPNTGKPHTDELNFSFEFFVYPWYGEERFGAVQYKAYRKGRQSQKNQVRQHWHKYLCEITNDPETIARCVLEKIEQIAKELRQGNQ